MRVEATPLLRGWAVKKKRASLFEDGEGTVIIILWSSVGDAGRSGTDRS